MRRRFEFLCNRCRITNLLPYLQDFVREMGHLAQCALNHGSAMKVEAFGAASEEESTKPRKPFGQSSGDDSTRRLSHHGPHFHLESFWISLSSQSPEK